MPIEIENTNDNVTDDMGNYGAGLPIVIYHEHLDRYYNIGAITPATVTIAEGISIAVLAISVGERV